MSTSKLLGCAGACAAFALAVASANAQPFTLTPLEQLGKALFFDSNLSTPPGEACAVCHGPAVGFTGPNEFINLHGSVYQGAVPNRFGNRKPPAAAYAGESPVLYYDEDEEIWEGGMFWDGRATGWVLGDPLAEQAMGPFLNPLEQDNPGAKQVCLKVERSDYAALFRQVWGPKSLDPVRDVAGTYERIARSIAAYERSAEVNPFTSKYDYYLKGQVNISAQEAWGLELFEGKAGCAACHISEPEPNGAPPMFTDYTYDNLGVPKNPENPFYYISEEWNPAGTNFVDYGLGGFLKKAGFPEDVYLPEIGRQKVPTLRNVDKRPYPEFVKAYGHNGYFKSLEEITHFYNTRDVPGAGWNGLPWPPPEVPETVNHEELGNLGLTPDEEAAVIAFMKTLNDGYMPPAK